jgi:hypothetical protein
MELDQMHDTREGWLSDFINHVKPRLEAQGYSLPAKLKIACGFPIGSRGGKKVLAQCISPEASADGTTEMYVSPVMSDPVRVMGAALHEIGHAAVGVEAGHGTKFKAFCAALGLEGKATEAMPGISCEAWLRDEVLPMLGAYPHAAVDPSQRKKQGTRMIKLVCPETGYTVRTTKKWLALGVPTSPAGCEMVVQEDDSSEE